MSANETAEAIIIVIKRILKWLLWSLIAVCALIAVAIGYTKVSEYINNRPVKVSKLNGISLGDKLTDASFKFGEFSELGNSKTHNGDQVEGFDINDSVPYATVSIYDTSSSEVLQKYYEQPSPDYIGVYWTNSGYHKQIIWVKEGIIEGVAFNCSEEDKQSPWLNDNVNGVHCGDSGEKIIDHMKDSIKVYCFKDNSLKFINDELKKYRIYVAEKYQVRYLMRRNLVDSIAIGSLKLSDATKSTIEDCK